MITTSAETEATHTDVPDEPIYMVGQLVLDTHRNRVGLIMEARWGRLWLRPPGGGREWECERANAREVDPHEALHAALRDRNWWSRWGL